MLGKLNLCALVLNGVSFGRRSVATCVVMVPAVVAASFWGSCTPCVGVQPSSADASTATAQPVDRIVYCGTVADVQQLAETHVKAGHHVAVDPTGTCLAVVLRSSDVASGGGGASDTELVLRILRLLDSKQLSQRSKGFLSLESLHGDQRTAAVELARRHRLGDSQGKPINGGRLAVGIWPSWTIHIVTHKPGGLVCRKFPLEQSPPSLSVVSAEPLKGSVLWYTSGCGTAEAKGARVTMEKGVYTLSDLLHRLSEAGGPASISNGTLGNRRLSVDIDNAPVASVLWAIEVASGVQIWKGSSDARLNVSDILQGPRARSNALRGVPGIGYFALPTSTVVRDMVASLQGGSKDHKWIGWALSDLPLLYRNMIADGWSEAYRTWVEEECEGVPPAGAGTAPALDGDAWVLWTKVVRVCVESQKDDGSGGGVEVLLPVFD